MRDAHSNMQECLHAEERTRCIRVLRQMSAPVSVAPHACMHRGTLVNARRLTQKKQKVFS